MTAHGNNVLVSGIFGHVPLQIDGIFIAKLTTFATGVEDVPIKIIRNHGVSEPRH